MKGAYLELWADALGSIGVIIGGGLIWATGWTWIDPLVAVAIALWVLPRTWGLLRTATHILMQGVPSGINLAEIRGKLAAVEGVGSVHDLHIWSVAGDDISLTAHIVLAPGFGHEEVRAAVVQALGAQFDGKHITLQTEELDCSQAALLHA
jgi:cobalt-zinc-cadmium efflux system protein